VIVDIDVGILLADLLTHVKMHIARAEINDEDAGQNGGVS